MTGAGIPCVECGDEYDPTDEPGVYRCRSCGHELQQAKYVEGVADRLRDFGGFEDVASWLDEQAERLAEGRADG